YGCIQSAATRRAALDRVRPSLRDGARVFLSHIDAPRVTGRAVTLARAVGRLTGADLIVEARDSFRLHHSKPPRLLYEHWFTREEIESEIASAGYRVVFHDRKETEMVLVAEPRRPSSA